MWIMSHRTLSSLQSNKLEDRLDEAIHVLQRHASGQGGPGLAEMQSLLASGLGLSSAFSSAAHGLTSRLPGMVRFINGACKNKKTKKNACS